MKPSLSLAKNNQFIIFLGINTDYFETLAISVNMTGGRRAEFSVTAGGVYSYNSDLNGKIKYVVEIADG